MMKHLAAFWPLILCALILFGIKFGVKFIGAVRDGIKRRH